MMDPGYDTYNPNAVIRTDALDIYYAFGGFLGLGALPSAKTVAIGKAAAVEGSVVRAEYPEPALNGFGLFGRKTRNGDLAGKIHPKTGVPFDAGGYPDFSSYLYSGGDVGIIPTGKRSLDEAAANAALGISETPAGYTWHHHQQFGRMQLVERAIHKKTGHTGGFKLWYGNF